MLEGKISPLRNIGGNLKGSVDTKILEGIKWRKGVLVKFMTSPVLTGTPSLALEMPRRAPARTCSSTIS